MPVRFNNDQGGYLANSVCLETIDIEQLLRVDLGNDHIGFNIS